MTTPTIVSGAVSTISELGRDEVWMQGWLREEPTRLGLGDLEAADGAAEDDERSFVALDEDRCFSVDVQLGEMEASRGFQVLDNWARNRVRHPDKTHVAVLITEAVSDRYQTTLETLAQHLPLVVVELQVWKGDNEAIVVPHIALASDDVDLSATPAAEAAAAVAKGSDTSGATDAEPEPADDEAMAGLEGGGDTANAEFVAESEDANDEPATDESADKDDTGVGNPWGLPAEDEEEAVQASGDGSTGLLTKVR